jgi:hypothetical protein
MTALLTQPGFYALLIHTLVYLAAGGLVLAWGQRTARLRGCLGHY